MRLACALLWLLPRGFHAASLSATLPPHARGGELHRDLLDAEEAALRLFRGAAGLAASWRPNSTANWKATLLSHTSGDPTTYPQRFYYDTTFCGAACALDSTPAIVEFTGEWTNGGCPGGAVAELAATLKAIIISVEHRAYGCSRPGGGCSPGANSSFLQQHLLVAEAVEDSADFIPFFEAFAAAGFTAEGGAPLPLAAPLGYVPRRRWVAVGGSYAGALVSWLAVAHGDLLSATWSSSGVVNAVYNFSGFDAVVGEALGPDCARAVQAVVAAFEGAWVANNSALLALFLAPTGWLTKDDFAWMLADSAGMAAQYGVKGKLCAALNSTARATAESPPPPGGGGFPTGWPALQAFANFTRARYGDGFASSCYYSTACLSAGSANATLWSDTTTWVWQCCRELAYWNVPNGDASTATRPQALTAPYFMSQCAAAWPEVFPASPFPDTAAFNARWGGARGAAGFAGNGSTRIVAMQGSDGARPPPLFFPTAPRTTSQLEHTPHTHTHTARADPWKSAGVQSTISSTYLEYTATCAGCSHCRDLQGSNPATDPPELAAARAFALQTIVAWVAPGGAAAAGASPGFTAGQAAAVGAILAGVVGVAVASSVRAGRGSGAGPSAEKRPLLAAR